MTARKTAAWYAGFTGYALLAGLLSGLPVERWWGLCAAGGYAAAALIARWRPSRWQAATAVVAAAGAVAAPLAWQVTGGLHQPKTGEGALRVVDRAGWLLLHHGTPYLASSQLSGPVSYNPYEPVLAVFGLPRGAGLAGWAGDPRLWFGIFGVSVLLGAFLVAGQRRPAYYTAALFSSPLLALPLVLGGTDVPVLALLCLTLALLRKDPGFAAWAGLTVGLACAMKATAWPAVPVIAIMLAVRDGDAIALRFAIASIATTVAGMIAAAPAALASPGSLTENVVVFPLGLTRRQTTAASPLPGHLLAEAGVPGHWAAIGFLAAAIIAAGIWLALRPPADLSAASHRLALLYAVIFIAAPATRWGYFIYPLTILAWNRLASIGLTTQMAPGEGPSVPQPDKALPDPRLI